MEKNRLDLSKFKTSSAGTTVDSKDDILEVKMEYSPISWFFITWFGTTRVPKKITFKCLKTGEIFEELTKESLMKYYITYTSK